MQNPLSTFNEMNLRAKIGFASSGIIVLLLAILAFVWLLDEPYAVLFSELETRDAANVVNQLEQMKVAYRFDESGDRILVPENQVHALRLRLMDSNLVLSGGVGFEIFDESDFGMTEFSQRINYQRALQGELARTIMSFQAVKYARVHLVMPERGLFQQQDNNPSASVALLLKNNHALDDKQIVGIQRLVASAVQDLHIRHVTVTDQNGLTLSQPVSDDLGVQAVSERLQQKQAVEQYLRDKLNHVLSKALGPNQVMVSVDVSLDFSQIKTTRENVIPVQGDSDGAVLRRRESRFGGDAQKSDGGNITKEVEYRLGRSVAEIIETPGKILRLSVGVLVPADIDERHRQQIQELVNVSAGIDKTRGDSVAFYPVRFSDAEVEPFSSASLAALTQSTALVNNEDMRTDSNTKVFDIQEYMRAHPVATLGLLILSGSLLLILLIKVLFLPQKKPQSDGVPLSQAEREQILRQLQRWLDAEQSSPGLEARSHE